MAEQVQASLDQMVAPLADLMDRKIFSQSEIHSIVARRREYEYLLRRRAPRKADHLKYISDELQLEKLRQLRTKKQQAMERERFEKLGRLDEYHRLRDEVQKTGKNIGDPHIKQHIHLLFRRALRKYNRDKDVSIYLQYADVCKQLKSYTKLPQVYAEALQIHPKETGLWIEAASHEFFHRQSVSSARILLQRALRINPKAQDLWLQSFALEFHHIVKMQGRKSVLLDQQQTTTPTPTPTSTTTTTSPSPSLYTIVKIVYDSAIEAIPDNISFRFSFLDLCNNFPNEYTSSIESYIFSTIRKDFHNNPKSWIARADNLLNQKIDDSGSTTTIALEEESSSNDNNNNNNGEDSKVDKPKGFTIAPKQTPDDNSDNDDDDEEEEDSSNSGSSESSDDSSDSSEEDDDDDDDDEEEKRPMKKRRTNNNNEEESKTTSPQEVVVVHYHSDPVLAMIQKAIRAVETSEMYLQSVKFLWSYWEKAELIIHHHHDGDDQDKLDDIRHDILLFLQDEVLSKAAATATAAAAANNNNNNNNNIYNVSLALEHAEFYTRVDKIEAAQQVLIDFKDSTLNNNNSNNSSSTSEDIRLTPIWLELAELTFQQQSPAAASVVLKEALRNTPMSHPDYFPLLLNLLGVELIHENNNNNSAQQQQQSHKKKSSSTTTIKLASRGTFQKVLLLAGGGGNFELDDDNDSNDASEDETGGTKTRVGAATARETSFGIKTVEQACWQFLLHMIDLFGPVNGVRKTCDLVLSESNFLQRQNAGSLQDVETIAAFFDKCLELELKNLKRKKKKKRNSRSSSSSSSSNSELQKGKVRIRQLFDAAIRLFSDVPSLAAKFQQERLDASLLL